MFSKSESRLELLYGFEHILADPTQRAGPVVGNVGESCPWLDAVFGVAFLWVVHPVAYCAYVFFHNQNKNRG